MLTAVRSYGMLCHIIGSYTKSWSFHRGSWYHHGIIPRTSGELSGTLLVTKTISPCIPNPKTHCSLTQCCYFPRSSLPPVSYDIYLQVSGFHTTFTTSPNPFHYIWLSHWSHSHYKMWSSHNNTILTYSLVQSPSWEANWFAASQEITRISWNTKVHYRAHKCPPPVSILGQPNPVHIPTSHLLEIHPNIMLP